MSIKFDNSKFIKKIEESIKKLDTSQKTNQQKSTDNVQNDFNELFDSTNKNTIEEIESSFLDASKELGLQEEEEDVVLEDVPVEQSTNSKATPEEIKDIASNFSTGEVFEVPGENKAYIKQVMADMNN